MGVGAAGSPRQLAACSPPGSAWLSAAPGRDSVLPWSRLWRLRLSEPESPARHAESSHDDTSRPPGVPQARSAPRSRRSGWSCGQSLPWGASPRDQAIVTSGPASLSQLGSDQLSEGLGSFRSTPCTSGKSPRGTLSVTSLLVLCRTERVSNAKQSRVPPWDPVAPGSEGLG